MTATTEMTAPAVPDRYPTRVAKPESFGRRDPVVYEGESGPLSRFQLNSFDRNGYIVIDQLLDDDEVDDLRQEMERLASPGSGVDPDRLVHEPYSKDVRSVFEVHKLSHIVAKLVADDRLAGAARQILGSDVYIHQSRVNRKPGFAGKEFAWHSDFETWHAEDGMPAPRCLSISVAMTPNYDCNGSLMIIPGSHRTFVATVGETPENNFLSSLKRQELGVPDQESLTRLVDKAGRIDTVVGPAGSALLFDCNCMHGSAGNMTPYPRSNFFVVYNSIENSIGRPYAAPAPRPEYIASRDFTPVS